jgi:hypothetical protein
MARATFSVAFLFARRKLRKTIAAAGALAIDSCQSRRRADDIAASRHALRRSMHATVQKAITLPGFFFRQQLQQHLVRGVAMRLGEAFFEQRQVLPVNIFFHARLPATLGCSSWKLTPGSPVQYCAIGNKIRASFRDATSAALTD